ncbi:PREDICTED: uncharacterized protein LOC105364584 isoform X2 [Ceratosolen solmsi marchali]|uniref:Uncharacterized protein LOC105364584 isoform X2 n=1 Tax=Ceratosolen solmsi marchali TaxID=326594 RepID=A0AAJ7DYB0_9HYME|nr:PREDICTED: uncharacterized protein LOC105364584 isoform X2 [Ceratosolen solmsi marchali]
MDYLIPVLISTEMSTILTKQQIVDAIKEVLFATLTINLENVETFESMTKANEMIITTPNVPDASRIDYNTNNDLHTSDEKSIISDNKCSIAETDTVKIKKTKVTRRGPAALSIIEEAYKNSMKVQNKLEELKELIVTDTKPNLRLSSIIRLSNPKQQRKQQQQQHQHQQQHETFTQCATARRRFGQPSGSVAPPVTPTSTRPCLAPSCRSPRKRLQECRPPVQYSQTLSVPIKSQSRKAKFAHVKSTIPKPTTQLGKRKPQ